MIDLIPCSLCHISDGDTSSALGPHLGDLHGQHTLMESTPVIKCIKGVYGAHPCNHNTLRGCMEPTPVIIMH